MYALPRAAEHADRRLRLGRRRSQQDVEEEWLAARVPDVVTWEGWETIGAQETAAGEPQGRPRVKLVRLHELLEASRTASARR